MARIETYDEGLSIGKVIGIAGAVMLGILILLVIFGSWYIIPAGERGVLLTFGNPSIEPRTEGLHFKIPMIQSVVKMDIKTQKYEAEAAAASRDLQDIKTKIATNYHLVPEMTPELYKDIGLAYQEKVIQPLEQEIVKAITAKYTAEELITRREEVREDIKKLFTEKLRPRGIIIEEISIINFQFSSKFTEAIESKVTAEQLKLKADMDLQRIRVEKEQKITQAEAEAQALRLQKQEITPDLIKLRQIEVQKAMIDKWNGVMPVVFGSATPLMDITSLTQSIQQDAGGK